MERQEATPSRLTAGDVSRALRVDLKTVHNWVQRGLLHGTRTPGGHLRFLRTEVIRFLRRRARAVPSEIAVEHPIVVTVGIDAPLPATECEVGVFDALLGFANRACDVIVFALEGFETGQAHELAAALARQPSTQGIAVIGVSDDPDLRRAFLGGGADLALPSLDPLPNAIDFVTGRVAEAVVVPEPRTTRPSGMYNRADVDIALATATSPAQ